MPAKRTNRVREMKMTAKAAVRNDLGRGIAVKVLWNPTRAIVASILFSLGSGRQCMFGYYFRRLLPRLVSRQQNEKVAFLVPEIVT